MWVEDSYARTLLFENWDNLFLAKHCCFFWGWEEKGCGQGSGNLARPLGHGLCVTKHIFDELSVNQSKPDRLSFPYWLQNAAGEVLLLNMAGNLLNPGICKSVRVHIMRGQNWVFWFLFAGCDCSLLGRGKKKWTIPNQKQLQLSVEDGPELKLRRRKRLVLKHHEFLLSLKTHPKNISWQLLTGNDLEAGYRETVNSCPQIALKASLGKYICKQEITVYCDLMEFMEARREVLILVRVGKILQNCWPWRGSQKMFGHTRRRK